MEKPVDRESAGRVFADLKTACGIADDRLALDAFGSCLLMEEALAEFATLLEHPDRPVVWTVTGEVTLFEPGETDYFPVRRTELGSAPVEFIYDGRTMTVSVGGCEAVRVRAVFDNGLYLCLRIAGRGGHAQHIALDRGRTALGVSGLAVSAGDVPTPFMPVVRAAVLVR